MLNYLSLLGWNDGSEQEIYSVDELQQAFSLERITKSAAGESRRWGRTAGRVSWQPAKCRMPGPACWHAACAVF